MTDSTIYGRKLDLTYTLGTFAWIVETFLSEKRSIQSNLCVKLANASNERDSMAPISIMRAYEAKLKSRKQKINCNRQFSTPLSFLSTVDSFLRATTYNQGRVSVIYPCGAVFLEPETEIKRITSEIITQFRSASANFQSCARSKISREATARTRSGNDN